MKDMNFDWDEAKASVNKQKHGVSFEEAESVFYDEYALEFFDEEHFLKEERFIMLGISFRLHILVVCHCIREKGSLIRIISARKATKQEARHYWEARS